MSTWQNLNKLWPHARVWKSIAYDTWRNVRGIWNGMLTWVVMHADVALGHVLLMRVMLWQYWRINLLTWLWKGPIGISGQVSRCSLPIWSDRIKSCLIRELNQLWCPSIRRWRHSHTLLFQKIKVRLIDRTKIAPFWGTCKGTFGWFLFQHFS